MTESDSDKVQIGTSALAKSVMDDEKLKDYFHEQRDMIKFAVALALSKNLDPVYDDKTMTNSQATHGLDNDGSLANLVRHYKVTATPYRASEALAEAGFRYLAEEFERGREIDDFF